ncbi:tetratricopeptide repeat-containing serine protease family protein [Kamptonema sp. UHCC 0994]|uniref:tetratricopeptide repeat-containing S1 family peptidase n=1 Tax=Kamptonema sp. UHCC 0994 TaxID=3031329 RepID=UPI0023B8CEB9|nr:tetratricopeptide repeat-containing serine protease family protein [Kamptonema sp. UHCC 0994]MDF0555324.1 tetratricopeptide repeat-containing serine protease family protein [Kamptonema sp. UHCC 0994]
MSRGFSRFNSLACLLAGTIPAIVIVVSQATAASAKTAQEIAEIAGPITVQVNSSLGDGSGVIIAKGGNTYTVLTVNHVVETVDVKYTIRTSTGKNYQATSVTRLQKNETDPDLAVVKFESSEEYPIAIVGDSDQAAIGAQIYVYGYPATGGLFGAEREAELSGGFVTSRPRTRPEGYTLRYQAVTWSGMSGGPVFDADGRLVGLHGQGEFGFAQTSSGEVAPIKTGFNAAVPINMFIARLADAGVNKSELKVNNSPASRDPVSLGNPQDSQGYYLRALSNLDEGKLKEAIADFNRSLELNPKNSEAYFNRGVAYAYQGETIRGGSNVSDPLKQAIEDYTLAIKANPGYADAYYNRGLAHLANNDKPGAVTDFQKAAELYQKLGRKDDYQQALKKIKELQ